MLPLRRIGLPLTALVSGAVAPDLPVFLPVGVPYSTTHSWAGLALAAILGVVLLVLWLALVRDAVVDLVPVLRRRAAAHVSLDDRARLLAPVAVVVGASTHVLWDSATHDWGFVVQELALLRREHGPFAVYSWLQLMSTGVGSAVVLAYGVRRLRGLPTIPLPSRVSRPGLWAGPVVVGALVAGLATRDVERTVGGALLGVLAVALVWRLVATAAARAAPSR